MELFFADGSGFVNVIQFWRARFIQKLDSIMHCIASYCVLCLYLICYLYTNVSTKVTRNKDLYIILSC